MPNNSWRYNTATPRCRDPPGDAILCKFGVRTSRVPCLQVLDAVWYLVVVVEMREKLDDFGDIPTTQRCGFSKRVRC